MLTIIFYPRYTSKHYNIVVTAQENAKVTSTISVDWEHKSINSLLYYLHFISPYTQLLKNLFPYTSFKLHICLLNYIYFQLATINIYPATHQSWHLDYCCAVQKAQVAVQEYLRDQQYFSIKTWSSLTSRLNVLLGKSKSDNTFLLCGINTKPINLSNVNINPHYTNNRHYYENSNIKWKLGKVKW